MQQTIESKSDEKAKSRKKYKKHAHYNGCYQALQKVESVAYYL